MWIKIFRYVFILLARDVTMTVYTYHVIYYRGLETERVRAYICCLRYLCMYGSGPLGFEECLSIVDGRLAHCQICAAAACEGHQVYGIGVQMFPVCMVLVTWTAISVLKGITVART